MKDEPSVLVTGASGFIGTALVRRLVLDGVRVVCLTRVKGTNRREPIVEGVQWIHVKDHHSETLRDSLSDLAFSCVFNLAAYGVRPEDRNTGALIDGNIRLLAGLLEALAERPPSRFLHIGSCSEFGPVPFGVRLTETHPLNPASLYGAAKVGAALFGRNLAQNLGMPFVTLRLFGVYGPGEASYRLIPYLLARLQRGERVDLTPGEQVRDLLYVDDVAAALRAASSVDSLRPYESYNVCSGEPVRIRDIANSVCREIGAPTSLLAFGARPYRADEPMWLVGDPAHFRSLTGWMPRVSREAGIRRIISDAQRNWGISE